jgi:hypothetical protein
MASLAAQAVATLAPLLLKDLLGEVKGSESARELLRWLEARLAGDQRAAAALMAFEREPTATEPELTAILEEKVAEDKGFQAELAELLANIGPEIRSVPVV